MAESPYVGPTGYTVGTNQFSPKIDYVRPAGVSDDDWKKIQKYRDRNTLLDQQVGEMPQYTQTSLVDPKTGMLADQYQLEAQLMDPSSVSGYGQFEDFATGVGPSEYAQEAQKGLDLKTQFERDRISAGEVGQAAQARAGLAMRGGLSGGARERVGQGVMAGGQDARQQARQSQLMGTAGLLAEDARSRQGALERFTGMGIGMQQWDLGQKSDAQKFNVGQALDQIKSDRLAAQESVNKRAEIVGQQRKDLDALLDDGCWLISGLAEHVELPEDENDYLTQFKRYMLVKDPEYARFYLIRCAPLIKKMDKGGFNWSGFEWFNSAIMTLLKAGEFDSVMQLWKTTVHNLLDEFWPSCPSKVYKRMQRERNDVLGKQFGEIELPQEQMKFNDPCAVNCG